MKIVTETQNLMVIKDSRIFVYFIGLVFAAAGCFLFFSNLPIWASIIVILFGLFVIFMNKSITITLDKNADKMSYLKRGVIGKNLAEYDLNQIKEIELWRVFVTNNREVMNKALSREQNGAKYVNWNYTLLLLFIMSDGQKVFFSPGNRAVSRSFRLFKSKEEIIGSRVAFFLGIPFNQKMPVTAAEMKNLVQ